MTLSPNWDGRWRRDGLAVTTSAHVADGFCILPADDRPALDACPCCDQRLLTLRAAHAVADAFYPLAGSVP